MKQSQNTSFNSDDIIDVKKYINKFRFTGKSLYHYTTTDSFIKIIESEKLWLTNCRFMNDSSELQYPIDITKKAINDLIIKKDYSSEFQNNVLKLVPDALKTVKDRNYIVCFTSNGDSLPMWNTYGKSGLAIEFDLSDKDSQIINQMKNLFFKIQYDEKSVINNINKMVDEIYANYIKNKENDKKIPDSMFYLVLAHSLVTLGMFYKYPAFKTEKEIRCLYYSPVNADDPIFEPEDIKFRKKGNTIASYVEIPSSNLHLLNKDQLNKFNHKLPIKSVTVGPGLDQDIKEEGLKTFLERKGYSEVEIKKSKIPYRDM